MRRSSTGAAAAMIDGHDGRAARPRPSATAVAVFLVFLASVGSAAQIHWHTFVDESETLYYGYRMARGELLYADMFSHHFPFPYWWAAATVAVAGKSITALRASLVLFQAAAFVVAIRLTAAPVAVGIAALVWSCVGYLYFGNLLIAYTFKALALMVVAAGTVFGPRRPSRLGIRMACVGVFGAIAVLTDPTTVYVVALAAALVALAYGRRALVSMVVPGLVAGASAGLWLYGTGSWSSFVAQAYEFNRDVYATFGRSEGAALRTMLPYAGVARQAFSALKIWDARWWAVWPETDLSWPGALHDRWLLTGLAFRLYVIALARRTAARGDVLRAGGLYGLGALLLALRGEEGFHASTFALVSLVCGAALVTCELDAETRIGARSRRRSLVWGVPLAALATCGAVTIWQERATLGYAQNFGRYETLARRIDAWACHDPTVRVSQWPYDLLVNWYADRRPLSRYAYVLPWTLPMSRAHLEAALARETAVVLVDLEGSIGPWKNREYLHDLLQLLHERYASPEPGVFVSRRLVPCPRDAAPPDPP